MIQFILILALPGELSVMQNQAIECILLNKTDYSILEYYVGEEMIIHVDEIDNNSNEQTILLFHIFLKFKEINNANVKNTIILL
ncbi:hypothetical protein E2986_02688 [Frieseomelitta varia]|uniref:Uncharacterized protein n=1 Tax=Frieseomelitta varia TaxID=561572 RepID=A0A833SM53_9HYME|nr:hypothetical protein E2986_02688 [Frieseomelitta varia]